MLFVQANKKYHKCQLSNKMLSFERKMLQKSWPIILRPRFLSLSSKWCNEDSNIDKNIRPENPVDRTLRILKDDMTKVKKAITPKFLQRKSTDEPIDIKKLDNFLENRDRSDIFQSHCDIVVIGGGGVGSSIAYWLKKKAREGLNVVVVEKDSTVSGIDSLFK